MLKERPALLGTALLAYSFGLRHAVDADHIVAIDNVTRKLMKSGHRPIGVGFWFSCGHSLVVGLAAVAIAATAATIDHHFAGLRHIGGLVSQTASSLFLLVIAATNFLILRSVWTFYRQVRSAGTFSIQTLDRQLADRGLLSRLCKPLFRFVTKSWHMFPLGFLFGLGFDTATEVGLLGISAAEAARSSSLWSVLLFPCLFAAGMTLIDTTDGVLMMRAYEWALLRPVRTVRYNLVVTAISVAFALALGGIEALGLVSDQLALSGGFWEAITGLQENFNRIGFVVIGVFMAAWAGSVVIYRTRPAQPS